VKVRQGSRETAPHTALHHCVQVGLEQRQQNLEGSNDEVL